MPKSLPPRANLEQLKNQAKDLLKDLRSGEANAIERARENHPGWARVPATKFTNASLSDAQLVIAREFGFASWPRLKQELERRAQRQPAADPLPLFRKAFEDDNVASFNKLLEQYPEMKARINEPLGPFDAPIVTRVRSREMLDLLLAAGADINAKSRWWAGGFGLLHGAPPELAAYAITRGASVDVHAAARLGLAKDLRRLIEADPGLVNAPGGDGQTPLHFARNIEIAEFLLENGADIEARDVDHESTPAQYMVRERQEVARHLVKRGCRTDLLMAAALGDAGKVREHLDLDPACIRMTVSARYFPKKNPRSGGTIYIWTLGQNKSAHAIAREFGHEEILRLLLERSPDELRYTVAFELGDQDLLRQLLARRPDLVHSLNDEDRQRLAHAAQANNLRTVQLMLSAGWPAAVRGQHGGTPLHWAAFHGNAEMLATLLRYQPPLEWTDADFQSTPLGWAIHGSEHGWYCRTGHYAAVVEALLRAGAKPPQKLESGTEAVKEVLRRFGVGT